MSVEVCWFGSLSPIGCGTEATALFRFGLGVFTGVAALLFAGCSGWPRAGKSRLLSRLLSRELPVWGWDTFLPLLDDLSSFFLLLGTGANAAIGAVLGCATTGWQICTLLAGTLWGGVVLTTETPCCEGVS